MNDEVARHLVEEFLKIDREISERILNVEWTQPEL